MGEVGGYCEGCDASAEIFPRLRPFDMIMSTK
jgi:hypothetical protein